METQKITKMLSKHVRLENGEMRHLIKVDSKGEFVNFHGKLQGRNYWYQESTINEDLSGRDVLLIEPPKDRYTRYYHFGPGVYTWKKNKGKWAVLIPQKDKDGWELDLNYEYRVDGGYHAVSVDTFYQLEQKFGDVWKNLNDPDGDYAR